jgi:hypothetical protein
MPKKKDVIIDSNDKDIESIYQNVKAVIDRARKNVYKTINFETVKGYWEIERYIVKDEQHGKKRASKGDSISDKISWTQYRTLLKVDSEKARDFYINEIIKANYGTSTFRRISNR